MYLFLPLSQVTPNKHQILIPGFHRAFLKSITFIGRLMHSNV